MEGPNTGRRVGGFAVEEPYMSERVEGLLAELQARHKTEPEFMERLRPELECILSEDTPEDSRIRLLELVAETCDRQTQIARSCDALLAVFDGMFEQLRSLVRQQTVDPKQ